MFVFPANDGGYRKRKRAYKACEQCKKRRRRCQASTKSTESICSKCLRGGIPCSLQIEAVRNSNRLSDTADCDNSVKLPPRSPRSRTAARPIEHYNVTRE
ncbi:hypothetical protein V1512DRAFT_356 [Lipomyces arxii]|uniref:uncharacterized protein n=1 Tax=Lipomyces arxii TaxID=56418 RepID=UPI0034CFE65C